ncbi:MAG: hypothetical protein U0326_41625 [Polyangiales bacterium]
MTATPKVPYRELAAPERRAAPPQTFERAWADANLAGTSWALYQIVCTAAFAGLVIGASWWPAGVASFVATGWFLHARAKRSRPLALTAAVDDTGITVRFGDACVLREPIARIHDVVVDSNEIQRVTYHQAVGDPLPNTQLSGDVRVGRLVARLDDGSTARLTATATHYSECMETFGKLRVFLRAHGWKPVDER